MEAATERRNYKLFGEAHPNAKLTGEQVVQIRSMNMRPFRPSA